MSATIVSRRASATRRTVSANGRTSVAVERQRRMLEQQRRFGPSASALARWARSRTTGGSVADRPIEPLGRQLDFARQRVDLRAQVGRHRIDLERERQRQVLRQRRRFEQHGALGEDPERVEPRQPVVAFGDVGGRAAEHAHDAGVRQQRAVDEVDEHFGGGAIEAGDGDAIARLDDEIGDAQRPQAAVVLDDAGELERRHQRPPPGRGEAGGEPGERLRRRADLADAVDAAGVVAVEVGAAGHQQPVARGDRGVARDRGVVVVAVPHLDRRQPGRDPALDGVVALRLPGMRQRGDAAGAGDHRHDLGHRRAGPRHERRLARRQVAVERIGDRGDVAGGDQRARDHRPADRPFVVAVGAAAVGDERHRHAERGQPLLDRDDAGAAMAALLGEERGQRRRRRIDAVAEDVDVLAVLDRGDLDAGQEAQAGRARRPRPRRRGRRSCRDRRG